MCVNAPRARRTSPALLRAILVSEEKDIAIDRPLASVATI
jgi:hypothetical protein